jgi:YD repeat-containing protein
MTAIVREDGRQTSISYETDPASARVASVTYPSGAREFFEYPAPDLRIYRDPDGLETITTVDGFSVVRRELPSGHVVENRYDDFRRLTLQTDNRGHSERRRYDKRGALVQRQFADGSWIRITRDEAGAPVAVTSDRGTVWEHSKRSSGMTEGAKRSTMMSSADVRRGTSMAKW